MEVIQKAAKQNIYMSGNGRCELTETYSWIIHFKSSAGNMPIKLCHVSDSACPDMLFGVFRARSFLLFSLDDTLQADSFN